MQRVTLLLILIVGLGLRIWNLDQAAYFGDMMWFFDSARVARESGHLPLLGITASITWLHQGPLWTYFLLLPVQPQILTILAGIFSVILAYFSAGILAAVIMAVLPFAVLQSQIAYHTSLIPLFFFMSYLLIQRKRTFLAGLFVGFLYLSHLLTFIYWPLWIWMSRKRLFPILLGFIIGISPFIVAGPIQTFGIFIWLTKQILTGFSGATSGISTAYQAVLLPGAILLLGQVIQLIYAFSRRVGSK